MDPVSEPEGQATLGGGVGCALMILAVLGGIALIIWVCGGGAR